MNTATAFTETNTATKIRRVTMLREFDVKEDVRGRQIVFSMKFVKIDGELVFLNRAVAAGLPYNMKKHRMRGVCAVDRKGKKIGHIYPVRIDNIVFWNGKTVYL